MCAPLKAAVIGGGSGAPVSIRTLLDMGCEVSSVVAMVDDGGSTGILRELGQVIPPGDVRKCILAMSGEPDGPMAQIMRHRFDYLDNHSLGNLVLCALAEQAGSFPEAIEVCERLTAARGHVFPSTLHDVTLSGTSVAGEQMFGQAVIGDSETAMFEVHLPEQRVLAYAPALQAVCDAELIVLGPGSLFTSIIPNLLVPGMAEAIRFAKTREKRPARTLFVCSLADMQGETWGMNCFDYVDALLRHGMDGLLDAVLIHRDGAETPPAVMGPLSDYSDARRLTRGRRRGKIRRVEVTDELVAQIAAAGPTPIVRDLVDRERPTWHDAARLQAAFEEVLSGGALV